MLKHIPSIISPELMKTIMEMGHGDSICFADANFPALSVAKRVVRADGHGIPELLEAIMQFFPLDQFGDIPVKLMAVVDGHSVVPVIWEKYKTIISQHDQENVFQDFEFMNRFDFYDYVKKNCFAVVSTGERALYGNIILQKGVVSE